MTDITNGELLKKIFEKVIILETKLDNIIKTQSDHERRIRFHDKIIWIIFGILIVLQYLYDKLK